MNMKVDEATIPALIGELRRTPEVLRAMLDGLIDKSAAWKPSDDDWSILEIVCHLVDEETDDFRQRIRLTLEDPEQAWPPIDPPKTAIERNYAGREFNSAVREFLDQRQNSVQWLGSLDSPAWENTHSHPSLGRITAREMLAAWVAHDQLHIRQIARRKYQLVQRDAGDFPVNYAGQW